MMMSRTVLARTATMAPAPATTVARKECEVVPEGGKSGKVLMQQPTMAMTVMTTTVRMMMVSTLTARTMEIMPVPVHSSHFMSIQFYMTMLPCNMENTK